ncbi:MAG: ABC transporter ATP-binding protein [Pseudomonadota bacterium]
MRLPVLSASRLSLGYRNTIVVSEVSFELEKGDTLAIVGHNGSGKSTLIKTLLGTLPPIGGSFKWANGRPEAVAYLGQRTEFDTRFPIRVRDLAAMGAWASLGLGGRIDQECQARIESALARTGIEHIADASLHELSAGQLQRALFARTMVQDASLILLDEPFTAVDQSTEAELLTLIGDWAGEGRTIILVLHDLSAVLQHCNKALLLGKGQATSGSPEQILVPENLVNQGYLSQSQADWMKSMYGKPGVRHV